VEVGFWVFGFLDRQAIGTSTQQPTTHFRGASSKTGAGGHLNPGINQSPERQKQIKQNRKNYRGYASYALRALMRLPRGPGFQSMGRAFLAATPSAHGTSKPFLAPDSQSKRVHFCGPNRPLPPMFCGSTIVVSAASCARSIFCPGTEGAGVRGGSPL
jgi:hypothetical protein